MASVTRQITKPSLSAGMIATHPATISASSEIHEETQSKAQKTAMSFASIHTGDHKLDNAASVSSTDTDDVTSKAIFKHNFSSETFRPRHIQLVQRIKNRVHTMHEQHVVDRVAKAERVQQTREAMEPAMATGERQLVGKDANVQDMYVDPPSAQVLNSGYCYPGTGYGYISGYGYGWDIALGCLLLGAFW